MDTYDYQNRIDEVDRLSQVIDSLSQKEAEAALKSIQETKELALNQKQEKYFQWFDIAVLPILQDFAEMTSSILTIEKDGITHITATLSNPCGLNITESCRYVKALLILTDDIGIDSVDGKATLTLVFDCLG